MLTNSIEIAIGTPEPLGVTILETGINFAIYSRNATSVTLCLFTFGDLIKPWKELPLIPPDHKTGFVWHILVKLPSPDFMYMYRVDGPDDAQNLFDPTLYLLDPYAKSVVTTNVWGDNLTYNPMGAIPTKDSFDWEGVEAPKISFSDFIIYEMHVRALTQHPSSRVNCPGTYLGLIEKIPHLLELGINAIELMPVHEFNECEYAKSHPYMQYPLYNFWGYSTTNFFSPMQRYAYENNHNAAIVEFKTMVREMHRNGIEVILDVVYNHTGEGNGKGPVLSWKGIDNSTYYYVDAKGNYIDFSGCGNTINCGDAAVQQMILDSLRYWVTEMHVDGFRFDLTSILTRGILGQPLSSPPLIEAISKDSILAKVKLIAEPWDAVGLYQLGSLFPQYLRWSEWNGRYRDAMRRFIRGWGQKGPFVTNLCGSQDLYYKYAPCCSVNFITAHDGFTLEDLVSYNNKHNIENGEENKDGSNYNESWNCGIEGVTQNKKVLSIRDRQMRNFHLALMVSRGIPMILMGDEYGHTRRGNNNAWCQDNDLNWFLWDQLKHNQEYFRFYKNVIHFRKNHAILRQNRFYSDNEIEWHGVEPLEPLWNVNNKFVAFTIKDLKDGRDLYIAFNADPEFADIALPACGKGMQWSWVINTGSPSPYDYRNEEDRTYVVKDTYRMQPFSSLVLEAKNESMNAEG